MTGDLYIRMVLALPEDFFKGWEWKEGDKQVLQCKNGNLYYKFVCEEDIGTVYIDTNYSYYDCSQARLRPLPDQKQLQDVIKSNFKKSDSTVKDYDVIKLFCDWFEARFVIEYKVIENESIDCIWLRYVMDVIYNKTWNGESWI